MKVLALRGRKLHLLAEKIGMSRSAVRAQVQRVLTNTTPLDYMTSWSMLKEEQMIRNGSKGLAEIACCRRL